MLSTDLVPAGVAAPTLPSPSTPTLGQDLVARGTAQLVAVPGDIEKLPVLQHMSDVMPVTDLVFGGGMLLVIMLVHAAGVRFVTSEVVRHSQRILEIPSTWRADLLMSGGVFMLLALHVFEMFLWAAALVYSGLVPVWRAAGFFAGNTYTTVGYGSVVLPPGWEMLTPLIAISGLFTFGWSGSVLVDLVGRCQKIKDAAAAAKVAAVHPPNGK